MRESGHLADTPRLTIEGPTGRVALTQGAICALRHIHMTPADAAVLGLNDQDRVEVAVESPDRRLIFGNVVVHVASDFRLELHLDTDEANAANSRSGSDSLLLAPIAEQAQVLRRGGRGPRTRTLSPGSISVRPGCERRAPESVPGVDVDKSELA